LSDERGEIAMTFEDIDRDEEFDRPPPEESNNRTFILVASILGGLMLLTLICTALYAFIFLPRSRQQREAELAALNAQNTAVAIAVTQTSRAARWTATSPPTVEPTETLAPTNTPVLALPATSTSTPIIDAVATTQSALFTLAAEVTQTRILTSTALPTSGFADEVGAPGLLALAVVLVVVIFLVRRLRTVG
jgi:hypothetical protein